MAIYVIMNNNAIESDMEKVYKSAPALGANNGNIFFFKSLCG